MNALGAILHSADVVVDVDAIDRAQLLHQAAEVLATRHGLTSRAIEDALVARERLGSTALGHGIALPHARLAGLLEPAGAFLRTRAPIPFDAPDGKSVSQFLVLVVPPQATDRHLRLLACAATLFGNRSFRDALRAASTPVAIAALLADWQVEDA
jgi:PTS system nitrogen regulatory IIA component